MVKVESLTETQESNKKQNPKGNGKLLLMKMKMNCKKHNNASIKQSARQWKYDVEHNIKENN